MTYKLRIKNANFDEIKEWADANVSELAFCHSITNSDIYRGDDCTLTYSKTMPLRSSTTTLTIYERYSNVNYKDLVFEFTLKFSNNDCKVNIYHNDY